MKCDFLVGVSIGIMSSNNERNARVYNSHDTAKAVAETLGKKRIAVDIDTLEVTIE